MKLTLTLPLLAALAVSSLGAQPLSLLFGGHADIGVEYEGGEMHLHIHTEDANIDGSVMSGDIEYEPDELAIRVPFGSTTSFTAAQAAAGVGAGESLWFLPAVDPGSNLIPFLGIGGEELVASEWSGRPITFTLGSVTSPTGSGVFSLWQVDSFGAPNFFMSSAVDSLTVNSDSTFDLPLVGEAHEHTNWGFSERGTWEIELRASGTHNDDGAVSSGFETFTFNVVPEPAFAAVFGGLAGFVALLRRRSV